MSRMIWKHTAVAVLAAVVTVWFLGSSEEVKAGWTLRDNTAVNPVGVCQDGAYIGVGAESNIAEVDVIANVVPTGEVLFDQSFTLPPNSVPEIPSLTNSGYFYVSWDAAFQPLAIGTEVDFGRDMPSAVPVIATVGNCLINSPGEDLSATFTYQGSLTDGNGPANGTYDFRFWLHDAASGGNQIGQSVTIQDVAVIDGLFTTSLNFGANAFSGQARWLEIGVRPGESTGGFTQLSPRQALTATPYALTLQPGAVISGTVANGAVLSLQNSAGSGLDIGHAYNGVTIGTANNHGIYVGKADNAGVYVDDARSFGVFAQTTYTETTAVVGAATADSGNTNGVQGTTSSPDGIGVIGDNSDATGGVGVQGTTDSPNGYGVAGFQDGYSYADNEFWEAGAIFGGRNGIVGITEENGGYAVFGINRGTSAGGFAGRFRAENGDGVWISAPTGEIGLTVTGGSKNAAVATGDGARLLYSEESTEVWFTDYGFGQLDGGVAVITIDPTYAQTVNLDEPYHVFLQAYGDADLYVANRTSTHFEVHLREGDASVEFSYRVVGKRLGFEEDRLERAPWADVDRHLYPDGPPNGAAPVQEQQR